MRRAVVIGAGVAGIAVSIRLALKGWHVTVFEANSYPGGKLSHFEMEGFRFDAGPSLFTLPHLVDELFELAGRKPSDHFGYRRLGTACRYWWEDGTVLEAPADPEAFAMEAERVLGVPATRLRRHLGSAERKFKATRGLFLERSLHRARTYLSGATLEALRQLPSLHLGRSMHAVNARSLGHPKLVQLFDRFATYNGSNPYRAPGVLNLIPYLEHGIGAAFPVGGMHAITESLVALAEDLGVIFQYGRPVERILLEKGRAVGVRVGGEAVPSELVVSNMDVVPTYRRLLPEQPAPERVLRHERSSSALIFYWGMNRAFPELDLHNIFFSADYKAEFDGIFGGGVLHPDPTVYVHISSKYEPTDAPMGMENWFVMVNVPCDLGQDWEAIAKSSREGILSKLSRAMGMDLGRHIVCEQVLDPPTISSRTSSFQGALYGASSNSQLSAFLRHPNFSSRIKGLYFCGGSVHPGGGIPLCLLSARIVSDLVPAA